MKIIGKDIIPFQENKFFSPLRKKIDYAKLILYSTRYLLIENDTTGVVCNSKLKVIVDKMSRLFLYKDKKCFSISYPFMLHLNDDNSIDKISTLKGSIVDSRAISASLAILNDPNFQLNPSLTDYYIESTNPEAIGISLLEEIFQSEPGYIRYDNDPKNEKGELHPLNHLDINYSSYGTYKLGLRKAVVEEFFENFLNINTNCSFLEK